MDLHQNDATCATQSTEPQARLNAISVTQTEPRVSFMKKSPLLKKFPNVAKTIKQARLRLGVLSQESLSRNIGYNNGQFISNIERGLCSLPDDKIKITCQVLQIEPELLIEAMLADYKHQMLEKIKQ